MRYRLIYFLFLTLFLTLLSREQPALSIDLTNRPLTQKTTSSITTLITQYPNLKHLTFTTNKLTNHPETLAPIIAAITSQTKLKQLSIKLPWNALSIYWGQAYLAVILANRYELKTLHLDLSWNKLGQIGIQPIVNLLKQLTRLEELVLTLPFNQLGDKGAWSVATCLKKLSNLKILSLDAKNNHIEIEGAEDIVLAIQQLQKLETLNLDLRWNKFDKEQLEKYLTNIQEKLKSNGTTITIEI